jgi:hypothetical protein
MSWWDYFASITLMGLDEKKNGDKTTYSCSQHNGPCPFTRCYDIETCEMWERIKGLCTVNNFLGWSFCLWKSFPK